MEAPSLALPTLNVGLRQHGRERAPSVIDVPAETPALAAAVERGLSADFRESLAGMTNPYGDGRAAERIVADAVRDAGFTPLMLEPIDFLSLYRQRLAQMQQKPPEPQAS